MASFPAELPDWQLPLEDQQEDIYLRSTTDVGPGKVRKRYTGQPRLLNPRMILDGAQRVILDEFYNNNVRFDRADPKDDTTQEFRFLAAPRYRMRAGAEDPEKRQYEVTLELMRLP